jgi:hypothetical protein
MESQPPGPIDPGTQFLQACADAVDSAVASKTPTNTFMGNRSKGLRAQKAQSMVEVI